MHYFDCLQRLDVQNANLYQAWTFRIGFPFAQGFSQNPSESSGRKKNETSLETYKILHAFDESQSMNQKELNKPPISFQLLVHGHFHAVACSVNQHDIEHVESHTKYNELHESFDAMKEVTFGIKN